MRLLFVIVQHQYTEEILPCPWPCEVMKMAKFKLNKCQLGKVIHIEVSRCVMEECYTLVVCVGTAQCARQPFNGQKQETYIVKCTAFLLTVVVHVV